MSAAWPSRSPYSARASAGSPSGYLLHDCRAGATAATEYATAIGRRLAGLEADPVFTNCQDYRAHTLFGRFTIRQEKKGAAIAWGAYSKEHLTGDLYVLTVRLNGKKFDAKSQNYPPHGSIPAGTARKYSGKTLDITGKVTKGGKLMLAYSMRCRVL
ncbi:hypothetical protein [Microlunatus parietis]|uniref:Uncharacterized protein n=1 Tax=Microlunatus parietis TaxID=682979 RepID=A0A7Y9LF29_9ACTN|nr:hypothetical protein [Microlunatus parietis]NYE73666.1 hypothetical protein [Microlunatus parietis]